MRTLDIPHTTSTAPLGVDDFLTTAAGHELSLSAPRPGMLDSSSIAWSLAQINRFNGHAARPYSVAEHSLLVCEIAERELGLNIHGQLAALLHDAHEAITGDMHTPGKRHIAGWRAWEERWEHFVRGCFALHTSSVLHAADIKRADLMALATERRDLLSPASTTAWACLGGIEPVGWVRLNSPERVNQPWQFWRDRWLDKYGELDFARNQLMGFTSELPA